MSMHGCSCHQCTMHNACIACSMMHVPLKRGWSGTGSGFRATSGACKGLPSTMCTLTTLKIRLSRLSVVCVIIVIIVCEEHICNIVRSHMISIYYYNGMIPYHEFKSSLYYHYTSIKSFKSSSRSSQFKRLHPPYLSGWAPTYTDHVKYHH